MRLLGALLLLVVLVPDVGLVVPCCADPVVDECCGPTGDCTPTSEGECALTADEPVWIAAPSLSRPAPAGPLVEIPSFAFAAWRPMPRPMAADPARSAPPHRTLRNLRI